SRASSILGRPVKTCATSFGDVIASVGPAVSRTRTYARADDSSERSVARRKKWFAPSSSGPDENSNVLSGSSSTATPSAVSSAGSSSSPAIVSTAAEVNAPAGEVTVITGGLPLVEHSPQAGVGCQIASPPEDSPPASPKPP